jgi:twitching motility protein PilT
MVQNNGSDLHLSANTVPMIRIRGDVVKVNAPVLSHPELEKMLVEIMTPAQRSELMEKKSLDFAYKIPSLGIFRINVFFQRHGMAAVMRMIREVPPTLAELKTPPICEKACTNANGLVLVCGPTGSGKSTTLAAMLNFINTTWKGHILTLEDPIEFQHESKMCVVNQRNLDSHFTTFASALKAALREDPDVILVGEMRDPETMALALKAAETGHLVFSTLHTNSAAKTVDRIINSFSAAEQPQIRMVLSETLKVVIAQKLIPSADHKKLICFHDVLVNTPAVANLIREGKTFQLSSVQQTGRKDGMQLLDKVLLDAVHAKEVAGSDAFEYANDKTAFMQWAPADVQSANTNPGLQPGTQAGTQAGAATPGVAAGAQPVKKVA